MHRAITAEGLFGRPTEALARWEAGELTMISPTIAMFQRLASHRTVDEVLHAATSDAPVAAGRGGGLTDVSAVVSSWIQTRATLIGALAAASALVVLALGVLQRRRRILRGRPMTTRDSTQ